MNIEKRLILLEKLATTLQRQQIERLKEDDLACESNTYHAKVEVIPGRKYYKINVGNSGKYMVDLEGNIWGIKAYGQVHKGHHYGTLETINQYHWGDYVAYKINKESS